jgi:hypothetical protein
MAKKPPNHGKHWSPTEAQKLSALAKQNTPTGVIALKLGRTEGSVHSKTGAESISLKPSNQSPYNRRKK